MPISNRKFVCGKADILSLFGVGFLTLSLITIVGITSNPLKTQLIGAYAKGKEKVKETGSAFQNYVDSKIRQRERTGACVGKYCVAEDVIKNQASQGNNSNAAPSAQTAAEQDIIDTYNKAVGGDTAALDTLKKNNASLAKQAEAQKVQNDAAAAAAAQKTCEDGGGTWNANGTCGNGAVNQPASNPINTPFSAPNIAECKDAAGSTYDFNYSGGKCTLTQKPAPQSAPASQPAPAQPTTTNNSLLNIATGNTSNQTDVNQVRNQCNSDKASGRLPSTNLQSLDCGLAFDLQQYALGKLQAAAPTTYQQAQQTNTTNLQQMGDCIRGGGTWLNNNTCQSKQVVASQPMTTIAVTPQQGLSIKMQTGGICLFSSDCESGNCSAGTCKASAPIIKYPQITMTQLNACTGSGGQIDLSTGKCAYSPAAQQNLNKLKSQCQSTQGCYWDAYTNQPINTGVPGIIDTLTFGQFSNAIGDITRLNQQYNSSYGTSNYKPVITPGGFNDTSANLQLAGTLAKTVAASAPVPIVGGATLAFGGELVVSTVTGAAAAGVPVSTYVAAQAGALTTTAIASSPLWLQQTIQTVSPYVAPVLTVGTTAPFAVNQTIQCGFAGSKFDSPGCASANEQAFYAAAGLQQMQDIEIALNSQKVSQSLPEVLANAKNSVTNRLFSDVAYDAAVNDMVTGAAANPAKYGLAVTPTTADLTPTKINMPTSVSDALSSAKTKASNLVNNLADQAVQSDLIGGNITQDVATGITSGLKGEPTLNQKLSTTLQDATNKAVNNFPIVSNEVQLEADQAMARNLAAAKPAAEIPTTPLVESPQPSWLARIQNRISQTGDDLGTNIKTLATDAQESLGGLLRKLSPPPTAPIAKQGAEPILSSVDQNLVESLKTDKTIRQLIETENYTEAKNLVVDSLTKNLPPSLDSKSPQIQVEIENAAREIANAQTIGGRVTAVENTISNSGYESFGTLVDKPTPPNVPIQREINVLGHTQVYEGGIIKPATVSFTPDEVKRIGDNSLAIAQRMQLPQSGNIDDVSQIIGSLNKSLADPGTQLGKDQRDLINILYSINSYPEGSFPDILNNFIKNGGKASDLPQLYADLLSENAGRYKSFQAFWDPVFKTYNDMLPDINAQLPEGVKPIKPIDPESTYWISGTEKNLSGKNCFTGYCSINSPIQDGERNYISMNVNLGLSDDVVAREKVMLTYPSGFTTESSISVPKVGDVASAGRNDALHVMLHESIHANTLDTIGIYRALPDDSIVTKTLEELTERTTIKIEDKLVQQFPEIYGAANRFTAYPTERTIGTGISNALGISDDDVMAYALRQDPIGYIKHLDDVYGKLDGNGYRNFVDNLYDNLKIGPAQKQFLLGNKPPSVMDVRLMVDDWAQNIKFFDRPISGYQGLLNLQKAGYTTYPEEAVSSADAFSRYIESSKNLLSQEGYIPKSFYSQTAEGQYILNYERPPIPENTTTKPNIIQQIRDFFISPQSEKGGGITVNVQPNGNPPTKDNFITQAWNKTKSYFSDSWTNLRENFGGLFAKPPPPATVEIVAKQNPFVEEDMFPTNIEPSKPAQRIETQTYTDLTNSLAQSKRPVLQDNLGSQITIEAKINQGGYGSIYYANYRGEGVVAKISTYTDGEPLIASEYGYIQTIRNAIQDAGRPDLLPRIVEAKAPILAKDGSIIGYVMNDIPGPTLNDYIIGGSQALSAKDIKDFKDIARILDDAGLPFGDIFPTNIAKDLNGNWVLFDPVAPNALESGHVIARGVTTNGNPLPDYFKNVGDNIFISPQTGGFIYQVPTGNVDALDTMIRTFDIQPLQAQLRPQPPAPFGSGIEEIQKSDLFQAIKNFLTPATSPTSEVAPAQLVFDKAFQYVLENRRPILFTSLGIGGGYTIAQNFGIIRTGIQNLWQSLPFNKQQSPLTTSPQQQSSETTGVSPANPPSLSNKPETKQLSFSEKADLAAQNTVSSNPFYGIPTDVFSNYYNDPTPTTQRAIFETYYTQSPSSFEGSGTNFGDPNVAIATLYTYGSFLRQQMQRGWALEASGMYGYHDELSSQLQNFHFIFSNSELNHDDIFLRKQASPLYAYFADQHVDANGQPIPQTYDQLNENQKRIYDLTSSSAKNFNSKYIVPISTQSSMTPEDALNSGKYVGIIATKSVNDLGRRFLLYKKDSQGNTSFVGVVLVGDYAKLGDWVGSGGVTVQSNANFTQFPLGTRTSKGEPWGFDLTQPLYDYYGGSGGPVNGIVAVDPDVQLPNSVSSQPNTPASNTKSETKPSPISVRDSIIAPIVSTIQGNPSQITTPAGEPINTFNVYMQRSGGYQAINNYGGTSTQWGCGPSTSLNIQNLVGKNTDVNVVLNNYPWTSIGSSGDGVLLSLQRNGFPANTYDYGVKNRITSTTPLNNYTGILVYSGAVSSPTEKNIAHIAAFDCQNGSCVSIDSYFSDGKPVPCEIKDSNSIQCGAYNYHLGESGGYPDALFPVQTP